MTITAPEDDFQADVLGIYITLWALASDRHIGQPFTWEGCFILGFGLGRNGAPLALAAHLAGAVSLSVDPDASLCRAALRKGACDFAVNTLDEAVRVMKNEIRKKAPLSVALQSPFESTMAELLERGIRPDLYAGLTDSEGMRGIAPWLVSAKAAFVRQAVCIMDLSSGTEPKSATTINGSALLRLYLDAHKLTLRAFSFPTSSELRRFDTQAADLMAADPIRHRWAVGAPRAFYRERPYRRVLYLDQSECDALVPTVTE